MKTPTRRPSHTASRASERGAALIVSVLLLLVVTIIALSAMVRNNQEERMAFNQRDRQTAFQAAEAALRNAQAQIMTNTAFVFAPLDETNFNSNCAVSAGVCRSSIGAPQWRNLPEASWTSGTNTVTLGAQVAADPIAGVGMQPRYIIEYQGTNETIDTSSPCVANFLITARGFGLNTNATVTLQSVFRYRIGACYASI
jgi:type IV pilus assembly protein PilX